MAHQDISTRVYRANQKPTSIGHVKGATVEEEWLIRKSALGV